MIDVSISLIQSFLTKIFSWELYSQKHVMCKCAPTSNHLAGVVLKDTLLHSISSATPILSQLWFREPPLYLVFSFILQSFDCFELSPERHCLLSEFLARILKPSTALPVSHTVSSTGRTEAYFFFYSSQFVQKRTIEQGGKSSPYVRTCNWHYQSASQSTDITIKFQLRFLEREEALKSHLCKCPGIWSKELPNLGMCC